MTTLWRRAALCSIPLLLSCVAAAGDDPSVAALADRAAVHEVMQRYVWSVDSGDADGYAAVFTEDGSIDSNGVKIEGRPAIRKVVTDLQTRYAANRAAGKPADQLYHVVTNESITLLGAREAIYRSYWQTMRRGEDKRYTAGGFGRSEDRLVKVDGQWLIRHRKLTVFTE